MSNMTAAGLIALLLFVLLLLVISYYVCLFYDKPPKKHAKKRRFDEGPLLGHDDDFNVSQRSTPPLQKIDVPDEVKTDYHEQPKVDDNLLDLQDKAPSAPNYSNLDFPPVVVSIENEKVLGKDHITKSDAELAQKGVSVPFYNPMTDGSSQKSDEEDGLVHSSILHTPAKESDNQEHTPKRVHFMPVPITVSIDDGDNETEEGPQEPPKPICVPPVKQSPRIQPSEPQVGWETPNDEDSQPSNPTSMEKVAKVLFTKDQPVSSSEDLTTSSSETDTSEPDVTEYSFETGPMVPSTSTVLADEISSSLEPKVTKISLIQESIEALKEDTTDLNEDLKDDKIVCPSEESLNTPPSTPPEGKPPHDLAVLSNPSAKIFSADKRRDAERVPSRIDPDLNGSYSSCSSYSDDDVEQPPVSRPNSQIPRLQK